MAILNNLIVNGAARFLNGIHTDSIHTNLVDADSGVFKTITTTTLDAETITTDMLNANNARVSQTLTVDGTISTNKWEAANIANIGGNFYISPTGKSDSGNITVTKTSTTTINGVSVGVYTLVVSGTFGVTSTSSTIWGTGSKVIFTGSISYPKMTGTDLTTTGKKYPLGTCDGTMSAVSTGTNTLTGFTITGVNSPALDIFFKEMGVTSVSSTACSGYEMQISVYQSYYSSAQHPIGILLTSYGKEKKQYIDIYGGANAISDSDSGFAEPSVRVGQLDGLPDIRDGVTDASSPTKPSGWGIYTNNGFFKGKVVANAGIIGGWNIGTDTNKSLYTGTFNSGGGIYISPSYSGTLTVGGETSKNWAFTAGNAFGVTTAGVLYASGAQIQGDLKANTLATGTKISSTSGNGFYVDSSGNIYVGNGSTNNFTVTSAGVLNATNAVLKGLTIKDSNNKKRLDVDATNGINIYNSSEALTSRFNGANVIFYDGQGVNAANITAQFGSTVQIGKKTIGYVGIASTGMDIYAGSSNINLAHFGYDNTETSELGSSSVTSNSPFFSMGQRRTVVSLAQGDNSSVINYVSNRYNYEADQEMPVPPGSYSTVIGYNNVAIGPNSCAEGKNTIACGFGAHSEGTQTVAIGSNSHAEGSNTIASGLLSHAEGNETTASGQRSHAQNFGTIASRYSQTAIGVFNVEDFGNNNSNLTGTYGDYSFIIGNGTRNSRSNALAVDWDGNLRIKGQVYIGCNADSSGGTLLTGGGGSSAVTGVKGSSESSYRTGQVELTAAHVGALPITGGTLTGRLTLNTFNTAQINMRPSHDSYDGIMSYQTAGNEAWVFSTKNAVTSFMFVNGEDTVTNAGSERWRSLTPGLQIKNNCVSIGSLIGDGVTPSYKLDVNGTVNCPAFNTDSNNYFYAKSWIKVGATSDPGGNYSGIWVNANNWLYSRSWSSFLSDIREPLTVTLTSGGWSSNAQTITVTGVTASNNVVVSPAPASYTNYCNAGVYCSAQAANSLTFTCSTAPTADITVNVLLFKN